MFRSGKSIFLTGTELIELQNRWDWNGDRDRGKDNDKDRGLKKVPDSVYCKAIVSRPIPPISPILPIPPIPPYSNRGYSGTRIIPNENKDHTSHSENKDDGAYRTVAVVVYQTYPLYDPAQSSLTRCVIVCYSVL